MHIATPAVLALALLFGSTAARAQDGSAPALFQRYNLLGTFAADCTQPVSGANFYVIHRILDAGRVQIDIMTGPTERAGVMVVDQATASGPNELVFSGASPDSGRSNIVYGVEVNRLRTVHSTHENGTRLIADGRVVQGGAVSPWVNRCG